jgi:hypothetical protein
MRVGSRHPLRASSQANRLVRPPGEALEGPLNGPSQAWRPLFPLHRSWVCHPGQAHAAESQPSFARQGACPMTTSGHAVSSRPCRAAIPPNDLLHRDRAALGCGPAVDDDGVDGVLPRLGVASAGIAEQIGLPAAPYRASRLLRCSTRPRDVNSGNMGSRRPSYSSGSAPAGHARSSAVTARPPRPTSRLRTFVSPTPASRHRRPRRPDLHRRLPAPARRAAVPSAPVGADPLGVVARSPCPVDADPTAGTSGTVASGNAPDNPHPRTAAPATSATTARARERPCTSARPRSVCHEQPVPLTMHEVVSRWAP